MSNIDKFIKLNLSMVKHEIGVAAGVCLGAVFCVIAFEQIFLGIILIAIFLGAVEKAYKKLYYVSLYEKGAMIYQTLPLRAGEVVTSKIFAGFLTFLFCSLAAVVGMIVSIGFLGAANGFSVEFMSLLSNASYNFAEFKIMAPMMFLSIVINSFCQASVIFAAVTWHNVRMKENKSGFTKAIAVFVAAGLIYIIRKISSLLGADMVIWAYALEFAMGIIIGILAFRLSVKILKNDFCAE